MKQTIDVGWARSLTVLNKQLLVSRKLRINLNNYMSMCFPKAPPDFAKCMGDICNTNKELADHISTLIFKDTKQIVGFIQFVWDEKERTCLFVNLCRARGHKGICHLILQTAIRTCQELHPTAVRALLHVDVFNFKLQALYESYGWRISDIKMDKIELEWILGQDQECNLIEFIS
jgi:hypothetical protein